MSTKKANVIFSSEELLRQAIAGLLERMPAVEGVRILHGPQEFGKDLVFSTQGAFEEKILCAAVVKNQKVTGTVDSSNGARAVYFQAEQALDTPVMDPSLGTEEYVQRVYIISPFPSSPQFISSIKGRLEKRFGQIVFIMGEDLFSLFKKHWPDFIVDEFRALEAHLSQLELTSLNESLTKVLRLYSLGEIGPSKAKIYVPRSLLHSIEIPQELPSFSLGVPTPERASSRWTRRELTGQTKQLESSIAVVRHFSNWNFIGKSTADEILNLVQRCRQVLLGVIARKTSVGESQEETEEKAVKLRTQEIQELQTSYELSKELENKIPTILQEVTSQARELPTISTEIDYVASKEALAIARLRDCIGTLPQLEIHGTLLIRRFEITEQELKKSNMSILIRAPAGYGKTSFCRWHALLDAEAFRTGQSKVVPVYVALHRLRGQNLDSIDTAFLERGTISALLPADIEPGAKIRLYLDGLDELPEDQDRKRVSQLAQSAVAPPLEAQVVLTSRDYLVAPYLSWLPHFSLSHLEAESQKELVEKWLTEYSMQSREFLEELSESQPLRELMRVPLLATLMILVFRQTRSLPESKALLYSKFVDLLSGGWDLAKGVLRASKFGSAIKVAILTEIAFNAHRMRVRNFSEQIFLSSARSVIPGIEEDTFKELKNDIMKDGLLVRTANYFSFSHHSFQEFLCAKSLGGNRLSNEIEKVAFLPFLRGDDWWREVALFFVALSENPMRFADWFYQLSLTANVHNERAEEAWKTAESSFPGFKKAQWLRVKRGLGHIKDIHAAQQ